MFAQTVYRRCLLHRKILENRLILMALSPNAVAPLVKNTLGYVAKVAGEVVYLMKCVEITVELRRESHCYEELPVTAYNKSYFMTPITRILQQHGEQTECNALIPPLYNLDNQWVGFDPSPSTGIIPRELEVDAEENYPLMSIKDLGAGGIYTDSEIRRAQNEMIFGHERNVLNNLIIRKMAGQTVQSQGFSSLNLIDKEELENLANSTIQKLYGYFTIIGEWTSGFLGIYFIIRIIKFCIETFMNAIAIHRLNGCSFHLLASFWDTLTLFLLHHKQNQATKEVIKLNKAAEEQSPSLSDPNIAPINIEIVQEGIQTPALNPQTSPRAFANLRKELARLPPVNWNLYGRKE
ncbi:unnamed protein product [Ceutorhynchus assimilis]|uniref:Uncharacterized protein n=1 Tax=Ceutorhynchus assimilis TaxID=467358 RepID=A0A9N9MBX2_9CUCU|nr:unnamed protein product [Ceutorhynchus assimilis]